jgi:hypothetical protein
LRKEQGVAREWFSELARFYEMISEGGMPTSEDAKQLFEVCGREFGGGKLGKKNVGVVEFARGEGDD